jgi:hypothetical protein
MKVRLAIFSSFGCTHLYCILYPRLFLKLKPNIILTGIIARKNNRIEMSNVIVTCKILFPSQSIVASSPRLTVSVNTWIPELYLTVAPFRMSREDFILYVNLFIIVVKKILKEGLEKYWEF